MPSKNPEYCKAYNFIVRYYAVWHAVPAVEHVVRKTGVSNYQCKTASYNFRSEHGLIKYSNVNEEKIDPKLMDKVRNDMMKRLRKGRTR